MQHSIAPKCAQILFHQKIFREIYSLVKTLLLRSFCQKSERVNFRNFCIVSSACEIVLSRLLDENSVQSIFSLIYNDKSEIEFHETTELHTVKLLKKDVARPKSITN